MEIVKAKNQMASHLVRKVLASGRWWWCSLFFSGARDNQHCAGRVVTIQLEKIVVGAVMEILKTKKQRSSHFAIWMTHKRKVLVRGCCGGMA